MTPKHLFLYVFLLSVALQCTARYAHWIVKGGITDGAQSKPHWVLFKKRISKDSSLAKRLKTPNQLIQSHIHVVNPGQKLSLASFKIHGSASVSQYYSTYTFPGERAPAQYLHWQFNPNIDLFNIPFGANAFVGTEESQWPGINSFGFHLDRNLIEQRIRNQINEHSDAEKELNGIKAKYLNGVENEYDSLLNVVNDVNYLNDIEKSKALVEKSTALDSFSSEQNSSEIKKARQKIDQFESAKRKVLALESVALPYKEYKVKQNLVEKMSVNKPLDETRLAEKMGLPEKYQPFLRILYGIKDFQFGLCYPQYSELTIRGTSIKGADLSLNPGNVILEVTKGKIVTPVYGMPFQESNQLDQRRNFTAGRIGFGKLDKSFIAVSYLHAKDDGAPSSVPFPLDNKVLGLQSMFTSDKGLYLSGEISKSITVPVFGELINMADFTDQLDGAEAYVIRSGGKVPLTNTRVEGSWKYVGPAYKSFGTPFLRTDNKRIEGKAEQDFFKRRFTVAGFLRQDYDNLLHTKSSTTKTWNYGLGGTLRLKNLPTFTFSYSPLSQLSDQPTRQDSLLFGSQLWTAGLMYTVKRGNVVSSTYATYNKSTTHFGTFNYGNNLYLLNQVFSVAKSMSFSGTACYADASGLLDRGKRIMAEVFLEKNLRQNASFKIGGYCRDQNKSVKISGGFIGGSFKVSQFSDFQLRGDIFQMADSNSPEGNVHGSLQYSTLCNLFIHW